MKRTGTLSKWIASLAVTITGIVVGTATSATVRLQQGLNNYDGVEDTYLLEQLPDATPGGFNELRLGYISRSGYGAGKALIRFDLSSLEAGWTATTTVTGVKLRLFFIGNGNTVDFSNEEILCYRVSDENRSWSPGTGMPWESPSKQACCWNYRTYDDTDSLHADGTFHRPWAGSAGLATGGVDYLSEPVATDTFSSSDNAKQIELVFTDVSFFEDWVLNPQNNAGFLLRIPGLETGTPTDFSMAMFGSSENTSEISRPELVVELENYRPADSTHTIRYHLPRSGYLSMHISDSAGNVVKELLHTAPRTAGTQQEIWNCKDGPFTMDDSAQMVPDGEYTVKMLQTQGLQAEYMFDAGVSTPVDEPWPGNHLSNSAIAADESGVYVAAASAEGCPVAIKMKPEGTRLWTIHNGDGRPGSSPKWRGASSMAIDGENMYWFHHMYGGVHVLSTSYGSSTIDQARAKRKYHVAFNDLDQGKRGDPAPYGSITIDVQNDTMIVISRNNDSLAWLDAADGGRIAAVHVADAGGAKFGPDGAAYVISGTSILKFAAPGAAAATFISGLSNPWQIAINEANGDLYIAEREPTHQVQRYDNQGSFVRSYGDEGGRRLEGRYHPEAGFRDLWDIAVQDDGGFWITEQSWTLPRRVSYWNADGEVVQEWFGGQIYASPGFMDPHDPSCIWVHNAQDFLQMKVNWRERTWDVYATYRFKKSLGGAYNAHATGSKWNATRRNGRLYLWHGLHPTMAIIDPDADTLIPAVISAKSTGGRKYTLPSALIPAGFDSTQGFSFSWTDRNLDGIPAREEIIAYEGSVQWQGHNNGLLNYLDDDFTYSGDISFNGENYGTFGMLSPREWHPTTRGIELPVYDWADLERPSWPRWNPGDHQHGITECRGVYPRKNGDYIGVYNYEKSTGRYTVWEDPEGNLFYKKSFNGRDTEPVYGAFDLEPTVPTNQLTKARNKFGYQLSIRYTSRNNMEGRDTIYAFGEGKGGAIGGNLVVKWDAGGNKLWSVGRHASTGAPAPGEALNFNHIWGMAHGCVIVGDIAAYHYVWDEDGLFAGRLLDEFHPNSMHLASDIGQFVNEQFAGTAFEIGPNPPDGLNEGDVIALVPDQNSVRVFRIHGFDQFHKPQPITVRVADGKIEWQTPVSVAPHEMTQRLSGFHIRNPYNQGNINITFSLAKKSPVTVELYSLHGRKIATLVNRTLRSGHHAVRLGTSHKTLAAGQYLVRMQTPGHQIVKPVVIVR